jgi:hypothetical protein
LQIYATAGLTEFRRYLKLQSAGFLGKFWLPLLVLVAYLCSNLTNLHYLSMNISSSSLSLSMHFSLDDSSSSDDSGMKDLLFDDDVERPRHGEGA